MPRRRTSRPSERRLELSLRAQIVGGLEWIGRACGRRAVDPVLWRQRADLLVGFDGLALGSSVRANGWVLAAADARGSVRFRPPLVPLAAPYTQIVAYQPLPHARAVVVAAGPRTDAERYELVLLRLACRRFTPMPRDGPRRLAYDTGSLIDAEWR